MKALHFHYSMKIAFDNSVKSHCFKLKCIPKTGPTQEISNIRYEIIPETVIGEGEDSFGNKTLYGEIEGFHNEFIVSFSGDAITGKNEKERVRPFEKRLYLSYSDYTKPGEAIEWFFSGLEIDKNKSNLENAVGIMHALYDSFVYKQGVTSVNTTAEEAFKNGEGVCQDYSHIFISLLRRAKIPSRYTAGMLIGEGATHAWVEIEDNGFWYALDPTNNCIVSDGHIKISSGRDYSDCVVNKGVFTGRTNQRQTIRVTVEEKFNG